MLEANGSLPLPVHCIARCFVLACVCRLFSSNSSSSSGQESMNVCQSSAFELLVFDCRGLTVAFRMILLKAQEAVAPFSFSHMTSSM